MYQVGDKIIYGSEGVCTVEKIDVMNISGIKSDRLYYYLAPVYRGGMIYAPVDTPVCMRSIISKEEALELIDKIPQIPPQVLNDKNIRVLSEHYQSVIKSCRCEALVGVIKAIYKKRCAAEEKGKKLGVVDERFMNKAEDMLWGELAVALDMEKDQVDRFIHSTVKSVE